MTGIAQNFVDLQKYSNLIKFKKNVVKFEDKFNEAEKVFMCMEGEIGVGKSTTNNHIMHSHCKEVGLDHT